METNLLQELETFINTKTTLLQQQSNLSLRIDELSKNNSYASEEFRRTSKDLLKVKQTIELIDSFQDKFKELEELKSLLSSDSEPELAELAKIEYEQLLNALHDLLGQIKLLTAKPLENDEKKAIIEIRPGVGGVEASLFAEDLFKMYSKYCNSNNIKMELYSFVYDDVGGIKEAVFLIDEEESFAKFRFEAGVHRVQRVPTTESSGRIHTSTASVVVMPEISIKEVKIKPEELRIDVYRSSGPGGQSVNTTDSAVRITHLPTGITVSCQNGKSQHKNKEMALSILASKLEEIESSIQKDATKEIRNSAISGGDRSVKIRTYNFQQSRITDHRISTSWFNIPEIMDGEIEEIVATTNLKLRN